MSQSCNASGMDIVTRSRARVPDSINPVEESYRLELGMVMRTKASGGTCIVYNVGRGGTNEFYLKA